MSGAARLKTNRRRGVTTPAAQWDEMGLKSGCRCADLRVCGIAGFQTRGSFAEPHHAGLETGAAAICGLRISPFGFPSDFGFRL
jgi:hypothetical protein